LDSPHATVLGRNAVPAPKPVTTTAGVGPPQYRPWRAEVYICQCQENERQHQGIEMVEVMNKPVPACPVRPTDACSLCLPGVSGPRDCGLVYLVMSDPDLRERLNRLRPAPS